MKSKCEELSSLHGKLKEARDENSQLTEKIQSIEALLEAGQAREAQDAQVSLREERESTWGPSLPCGRAESEWACPDPMRQDSW